MGKLLLTLIRFLLEKSRWLLLIVLVLLAGAWLRSEWQLVEKTKQQQQALQQNQQLLQQRHQQLKIAQAQIAQQTQRLTQQLSEKTHQLQSLVHQQQTLKQQRQQLWDTHWWARKNPASDVSANLQLYQLKISAITAQITLAKQAQRLWQQQLNQSPELIKSRQLIAEMQHTETNLAQVKQSLVEKENFLKTNFIQRSRQSIESVLPTALLILLTIILTPILLKVLAYFVVAPVVTRLPPVVVLPDESSARAIEKPLSTLGTTGHVSTTAVTVTLLPTQELLIHPDYLQSYSRQAEKTTRWFLNARLPFSSLAAGLVTLVCVRSRSQQAEWVQVSATRQAQSEVLILDVPEGACLVCKPHCLVGVIKQQQQTVRISRHWRLFHLHSWLTCQFRYLVFHGACQLIIKGHCGVIVDSVAEPRLIQQSATLAFSAGVNYANYRCETFVSYYMAKDTLFNDQFSGQSGIYLYEQTPDTRQNQDLFSRTLGGVWDVILKIFGI